jgi:predicted nuclease of predicted toxin-antitoxin system
MRLLADENVPGDLVEALASAGHDIEWVRRDSPGLTDAQVLERAQADRRILLTFDEDFGDLAYAVGLPAGSGVILVRIHVLRGEEAISRLAGRLSERDDWAGQFSVVESDRVRMRDLPPVGD